MAISFNGKNPLSNNNSGINTNPKQSLTSGLVQTKNPLTANMGLTVKPYGQATPITQGTNTETSKGLGPFNSTTTTKTGGGSTTKPLPNPSVLAQQQALNKQGAGLVEDGLAGPLTQAAIAKYSNITTPVKTETPATTSTTPEKTSTPATTNTNVPVGSTVGTQIQNVANTGAQTGNEANTQAGVLNSGNITNWENQVKGGNYVNEANKALTDFRQKEAEQFGKIEGQPIPLEFQQGREQVLGRQYAAQESALQSGVTNALENQGQQFTAAQQQAQRGATTAQAGYSGAQTQAQRASGVAENVLGQVAPIQVPYSNQIIQPGMLGQTGGTTGQLPQDAQTAVQSYAQQVKDGSMTRGDAESRLSAYGIAGTNALNEALGTSFNTNASNASAVTTAVGQQIQTAAHATNQALDTLSSLFNNLSPLQTQGLPVTNSIANWIGGALGSQALSQYKTNLADARSQLIGVLNSSGGTPTGNESTANQYLPDNMTKAQFDANVGTAENPGIVRQLVAQKVSSFTKSGLQNQTPTGTTGGATITTPSGLTINPNF